MATVLVANTVIFRGDANTAVGVNQEPLHVYLHMLVVHLWRHLLYMCSPGLETLSPFSCNSETSFDGLPL